MKLIIDIPEEVVTAIQGGEDYRYDIHTAIAQGKPFFPFSEEVLYKITDAEWEHSDTFWVTTPSGKKVEFEKKRPQGTWVVKPNGTTHYFMCNKCGSAGDIQDKYCRECGLKMKGGNEE